VEEETRVPMPSMVPLPSLPFSAPSGQPSIPGVFGEPLVGKPEPMGATYDAATGVNNFAVMSSNAMAISLVLFDEDDLAAGRSTHEIPLNPTFNRTGDVWHIALPDLSQDLLYGYRVRGPHQDLDPDSPGHRFDDSAVVLDPYAQAVLSRRNWGKLAPDLAWEAPGVLGFAPTWPQAAGALPSLDTFDWEGDRPLRTPMEQLVIYEMHVRGFTRDDSSSVSAPGTYAGMIERLDYLASLGVNAVELLPVQELNELEYYSAIPGSDPPAYRYNYWGYSTVGFFAPMSRYSAAIAAGEPAHAVTNEFKTLVKECHKRGIEVILDVVFNHTAEGNEQGLTLSFRGLDNRVYYVLAPGGEYYNYSGCGNTLNCNQPAVRQFIMDCLKFWVLEYHVDGFRFDLASILTRAPSTWHPTRLDEDGNAVGLHSGGAAMDETGIMTDGAGVPTGTPLPDPPLIEAIAEDPVLRDTKLIAEAWDCDGLNQVAAFPHYGGRWAEWNGHFRDTVRNFIKGMDGTAGSFAAAMCGSPNIYSDPNPGESEWWSNNGGRKWRGNRPPTSSINFVIAHDGFTLADLVSYNEKHNEVNGEDNRDGEQHNNSWNSGVEGPTDDWSVKRLRQRQMRNISMALLLAHGVPMLHMGDEYGHTKNGNNNTYCHDTELNWFNWDKATADEAGLSRFHRLLIRLRKSRPELQRTSYVSDRDVQWHGEAPFTPDWTETSRLVAYTLCNTGGEPVLMIAFNTAHVSKVLELPPLNGKVWQQVADTSKLAPYDFLRVDEVLSADEVQRARAASLMWTADFKYPMLPWSSIVLEAVPESETHSLRV